MTEYLWLHKDWGHLYFLAQPRRRGIQVCGILKSLWNPDPVQSGWPCGLGTGPGPFTPKFILKDTKIHLESALSAHHRCSHISSRDPLIPTLVRVACVTLTLETFTI